MIKSIKQIFSRYRIFPLVLLGLSIAIVLIVISLLFWSMISYYSGSTPEDAKALPVIIYLGTVFIVSALMTLFIKGGTVFPAAIMALLVAVFSLILADSATITFWPSVLKVALTVFVGVLGFTLTKLVLIKKSPHSVRRKKRHQYEFEDFGMNEEILKNIIDDKNK